MKTFIALAGVVVGGVTITAATILTVWNFTAGLLMLAAAFTVLVFTAWLIRRHEDRDELDAVRLELAWEQARGDDLEADLGVSRDRERELKRELAAAKIKVEDLRAQKRAWLGHYDVCQQAQAVAEEDAAKARTR